MTVGPASFDLPRVWTVAKGLAGEESFVSIEPRELSPRDVAAVSYAVVQDLEKQGMRGVGETRPSFAPPPGWSVHELRFVEGGGLRNHLILYTRAFGERALLVSFVVPEARLGEAGPLIERIVASVRLP